MKTRTTAQILIEAAETFNDRNKIYGDNYKRVGEAMAAMFPNGMNIISPEDWTRLYFLFLMQVKISRYANNWDKGGHQDSVHDAMVYAAMLEMYDEQVNNAK